MSHRLLGGTARALEPASRASSSCGSVSSSLQHPLLAGSPRTERNHTGHDGSKYSARRVSWFVDGPDLELCPPPLAWPSSSPARDWISSVWGSAVSMVEADNDREQVKMPLRRVIDCC